jgi:hypothetical protein
MAMSVDAPDARDACSTGPSNFPRHPLPLPARVSAGLLLFPRRTLIVLVRGYRLLLSPSLGSSCRFVPSCSAYALEALGRHGAVAGSGLTMWRIARCHPWCAGGHDPVPGDKPALFTGLLTARRFSLPSRKKSP